MGKTKRQPPKEFPLKRGAHSAGFLTLLIFGLLITLNTSCAFQPTDINPLTYWRNINDELYWLKHFNHLPGIRHEVMQEISDLTGRFVGDWIAAVIYFLPFTIVTVIAFKAITRRRYTVWNVRLVSYSIIAAILLLLGLPQY